MGMSGWVGERESDSELNLLAYAFFCADMWDQRLGERDNSSKLILLKNDLVNHT
jgi:hypothetical protein